MNNFKYVYASENNFLYFINPQNGEIIKKLEIDKNPLRIGENQNITYVSLSNKVTAINNITGDKIWDTENIMNDFESYKVQFTDDEIITFVRQNNIENYVYRINASNGGLISKNRVYTGLGKTSPLTGFLNTSLVINGILFSIEDGLTACNLETGLKMYSSFYTTYDTNLSIELKDRTIISSSNVK
jgi:outer membrane protein assembly factor BamB